jgi:hypothetical protein
MVASIVSNWLVWLLLAATLWGHVSLCLAGSALVASRDKVMIELRLAVRGDEFASQRATVCSSPELAGADRLPQRSSPGLPYDPRLPGRFVLLHPWLPQGPKLEAGSSKLEAGILNSEGPFETAGGKD